MKIKGCFFFAQKLGNLLPESKSFNVSSIESLCSHIFLAIHVLNTYKGEDIENTRGELGHKNNSTTKNSYIKAEKRGLNL